MFVHDIIKKASEIMLEAHDVHNVVSEKSGDANFVTKYDVAVETFLREEFKKALPEAKFIGEEEGGDKPTDNSLYLIIDPIDGTTNFILDLRRSAISIGICRGDTAIYGAVYDPYHDILYHAERGGGAFETHGGVTRPIHVSENSLEKSVVCFGTTPYSKAEFADKTFTAARNLFDNSLDLRRSGSAALDLCNTACGKFGFFFEYSLSPWDFAASSVIIEEAGGTITQIDGSKIDLTSPCSIAAGNKIAYKKGVALLN
jgi:myo-inositol-1(or 4)-monophosphatase